MVASFVGCRVLENLTQVVLVDRDSVSRNEIMIFVPTTNKKNDLKFYL